MQTAARAWMEMVGVELPIVQAPMAGVSTPEMAAAVSNAGALGSIGVGATDAMGARDMIRAVRSRTNRPFNVNVFCHRPAHARPSVERAWIERLRPEFARFSTAPPTSLHEIYRSFLEDDAMLAMLLDEKPRVVSFHFGLPSQERVNALRDADIVLFGTATNVAEAEKLVRGGVHVVVAQGYEAGGHRGIFDPDTRDDRLETIALTTLLVSNFDVPIVASGGIMDGERIAAMLKLGAAAAQLGTAFIACDESQADAGYRAALFSDAAHHTTMTRAISGRPARCLPNRFTAIGEMVSNAEIPDYPIAYDAGKALHATAKSKGEFGFGAQWAGVGAPFARRVSSAGLIGQLADEIKRGSTSD